MHSVNIRGHHLLCILTYIGLGYTDAFKANFDTLMEHLNQGAEILIVTGIDDICGILRENAVMTCNHAHVCSDNRTRNRDILALASVARILQMPVLKPGDTLKLTKGMIKYMREHFATGDIRHACTHCEWYDTCSGIAKNNFAGVKLLPQDIP